MSSDSPSEEGAVSFLKYTKPFVFPTIRYEGNSIRRGDNVHEEGDARGEPTRIGSRAAARGRTLTHRGLDQTRHRSGAEFAGGEPCVHAAHFCASAGS